MDMYYKNDLNILNHLYTKNKEHILYKDKSMSEDFESFCRICFYLGESLSSVKTPYILAINKKIKEKNINPYIDFFS